ncbi:MAG TPA: 1-deoxy-D-xylulose-5-phosphate synthase [Pirellulales bacterium]|nr:1-deoxy-D-xylulose-5-phosphate synthase [Pirellulales bacterium]
MDHLLSRLVTPLELHDYSLAELQQLAREIREELRGILRLRSAHFASNLGVVELCLALHAAYDFTRDRLIWDTGHQIYPQKMITGRYHQMHSIRSKGGLMGFPNPHESPYDLFMTGHAGCSISCALGLRAGDELSGGGDRRTVAVIGDGALPSGIVFEALNNAGALKKNLLVVLNDNQMSICPRVGSLASYLDKTPITDYPIGLRRSKREREAAAAAAAASGQSAAPAAQRTAKSFGTLFEDLGWRYIGPVDGHDLGMLTQCFRDLAPAGGPILLHALTKKGHGFEPAVADPVKFHAPGQFEWNGKEVISLVKKTPRTYTHAVSEAIHAAMQRNPKVVAIVAAMCEGNKLQKVRADMPERFFDTGICESHAVAFAAGMAKSGMRPIVSIYSTFMQRSYDQIFQEVSLQNLPVTLCMDRAGFTGPDGPTHHGSFDTAYVRSLPNIAIMSPGDALDIPLMIDFATEHPGPTAIRYPKDQEERIEREAQAVELGRAEVLEWGRDGMLIAYGSLLPACVRVAEKLRADGLDVGVINARFAKPIDEQTVLRAIAESGFVLTIEEGTLVGGFGSAVLEAANAAQVDVRRLQRLGLPDHYVLHAEREEQLREVGLDVEGIYRQARQTAERCGIAEPGGINTATSRA